MPARLHRAVKVHGAQLQRDLGQGCDSRRTKESQMEIEKPK